MLAGRFGTDPFNRSFGDEEGIGAGTGLTFGHWIGGVTTLVVACAEADGQAANGEKKEFFEHKKKGFFK